MKPNRRGRLPLRHSVSLVVIFLALAGLLLATSIVFPNVNVVAGLDVRVVTDPSPFPGALIGVPFGFQVSVLADDDDDDELVHLSLVAACPAGGVALLSGEAAGNACEGPIETSSKDLSTGLARWAFTVVYQGSAGAYAWTIQVHETGNN